MATIQTPIHTLITRPFNHLTDFIELADNCERYVEALVAVDDPRDKLALCGRLSTSLSLLMPTLNDPIPPEMVDMLTIDTLPTYLPVFEPETDTLCRYCQELTQLTMSGMLTSEQQRVIEDLLFELVSYFSGRLKAPRWLRTEQGDMLL